MRSSLGKIPNRATTTTASSIMAAFSTGSGRGRGYASPFQFTVDNPTGNKPDNSHHADPSTPPQGHGRGRSKPLPSSPVLPSFSSFLNSDSKAPPISRGRGFIPTNPTPPLPPRQAPSPSPSTPNVKMPMLFANDEEARHDPAESRVRSSLENTLPNDVVNVISGVGRGKPMKPPAAQPEKAKPENRHIRPKKKDKVLEFFGSSGNDLMRSDENWSSWFAIPYLQNPHLDPQFRVYFTETWFRAFHLSIRNFLIEILDGSPYPCLIED